MRAPPKKLIKNSLQKHRPRESETRRPPPPQSVYAANFQSDAGLCVACALIIFARKEMPRVAERDYAKEQMGFFSFSPPRLGVLRERVTQSAQGIVLIALKCLCFSLFLS